MTEATASLQTPPGRGGIAVIELTGAGADDALGQVFRPWPSHVGGDAGRLQLGHLVDGDRRIDEAVVCRHGQAIEINIHGGPQVAREAMAALKRCGVALAEAPRAAADSFATAHPRWGNPAIGAEMLATLPLARSSLVAGAITAQWSAGLSELASDVISRLDAGPDDSRPTDASACLLAADALTVTARLLNPPEVVLAGPPNAGKSTLANVLIGREVSIVHGRAGTTRDWVREGAVLDGVPIWLTDTAGLWACDDAIDAEAVARAHARASKADLVVLLSAETPAELPQWWQADRVIRVASKCDDAPRHARADVTISARTGEGLDQLRAAIVATLGLGAVNAAAPMAFTQRQATLLRKAARALDDGDLCGTRVTMTRLLQGNNSHIPA